MEVSKHMQINLIAGDLSAFEVVFEAYSPSIYSLAVKLLKNRELAQEIVQETFLKLWLTRSDLDPDREIWPFIYVIAKRLCFNQLRTIKYDLAYQQELVQHIHDSFEDSRSNLRDIQFLLQRSVENLPERQRQVWLMSREQGKSHKEIADELGISPNTVKNNIVQTLKILRNVFKKADYFYLYIFLFFL